jgi:hypothetical protein
MAGTMNHGNVPAQGTSLSKGKLSKRLLFESHDSVCPIEPGGDGEIYFLETRLCVCCLKFSVKHAFWLKKNTFPAPSKHLKKTGLDNEKGEG